MTLPRLPAALLALLWLPMPLAAQDRATGTTTIDRPAPPPRGVTIEQGGVPLTGTVAPGQAVDIRGANVVIVEDTPRVTRLVVRNDVLFDFDKAALKPEAEQALKKVAVVLSQFPDSKVVIEGYTDAKGGPAANLQLSRQRADAVKDWLVKNGGVTSASISTEGFGASPPFEEILTPSETSSS